MTKYTVTVPMPDGDSLKAVGTKAKNFSLVIENGWATFGGSANTPEDFELDLLECIEGLPENIKAVEAW
jgi:hypothetical protein|tara:strand:+ start:271 stop:477 length:207 start_codon:yes stop_codon:yes gene_type:complete